MESIKILHLSDLHIGNFKYEDPATLAIKIADTLNEKGRKVEIVVISGDVFDGRSKDIEQDRKIAILFFKVLINQFKTKGISDLDFDENSILFVPGNHDLVRITGNEYEKYDEFIKNFYPTGGSKIIHNVDRYNFVCDFKEKKIAILGFNSCRIEVEQTKENELKWINEIDFSKYKSKEVEIKKTIKEFKEKEKNWDDYGYINPTEMDNVFTTLKSKIPSYQDYTLVSVFHHHFYPFPEIVKKNLDGSFIRNYTSVIEKFQRFNIQLVLHGHKHMSIQRAITDNKFFENPESVIYVLSAGSIGYKNIYNPSFQWLRVFDKQSSKLAEVERYDFKDEELDNTKTIVLPPQKVDEKSFASQLVDLLQLEDTRLYEEYIKLTNDFEQIIIDSQIEKSIEVIGGLFTIFNDIKIDLTKNPKVVYYILLAINFRAIYFYSLYNSDSLRIQEFLGRIRNSLYNHTDNNEYYNNLISFISSSSNSEVEKNYSSIIKNVSSYEKKNSAYISLVVLFTDLLLDISRYGEKYFENENLDHKINIKLAKGLFYENIPSNSITLHGDIDRRAIIMAFKSKEPTVHKVAVLIIKDFEMRLSKFEDSLKEIRLKLYYIIPKVTPENYELENFHFDAYIPTLLPLLTGENLYKQKEVFIRELVQNSVDATLLRKQIQPNIDFKSTIEIEIGTEYKGDRNLKYFKIIDNGIGMSKFTIERYFTSIGRSFYVSEEFDKLKKNSKIRYEAISNFGIGFLSSFMVCREILVRTRHITDNEQGRGLEIEIPNYEGCFFIRNFEFNKYGTEITLYEDHRNFFDFSKFEKYIKDNLLGLPLAIKITRKDEPNKSFTIEPYRRQNHIFNSIQQQKKLCFYIPFSEENKTSQSLSWSELSSSNFESLNKFGIYFNFSKMYLDGYHFNQNEDEAICTNQGLKISQTYLPFPLTRSTVFPEIKINYPSSFIQLDVAREKILNFKTDVDLKNIFINLKNQFHSFIEYRKNLDKFTIGEINTISHFLGEYIKSYTEKEDDSFVLLIEKNINIVSFSIVTRTQVPLHYDPSFQFFWVTNDSQSLLSLIKFVTFFDNFRPNVSLLKAAHNTSGDKPLFQEEDNNSFYELGFTNETVHMIMRLLENTELHYILENKNNFTNVANISKDSMENLFRRLQTYEYEMNFKQIIHTIKSNSDYTKVFKILLSIPHIYRYFKIDDFTFYRAIIVSIYLLKNLIFKSIKASEYRALHIELDLESIVSPYFVSGS